jgi:MFS family permease
MDRKDTRLYYGWTIVCVSFVTLAIAFGIWYSFSVFFVAILKEFSWGRADTAGVFSVFIMIYSVLAIIIGSLLDRFGPRTVLPFGSLFIVIGLLLSSRMQTLWQFYLSYGFLTAIGECSIGHISHSIFLPNWFLRKRGLAVGIAMAGIGVGVLAIVPLSQFIISQWGWRAAYVVLAGIVLIIVIPANAAFQRKDPEEVGDFIDGQTKPLDTTGYIKTHNLPHLTEAQVKKGWTLRESLGTTHFWFLFLTYLFAPFATQGILFHQVAHMVDKGFSPNRGAFFVGLVGIIGSAAKILFGYFSDKIGRERTLITAIGCTFLGILCMLSLQPGYDFLLYGYSIFFGLGYGAMPPLLAVWSADLFHGDQFGRIFGILSIALGFGGAASTWIIGKIFDLTASYRIAFLISLSACVLVVFLFGLSSWTARLQRKT